MEQILTYYTILLGYTLIVSIIDYVIGCKRLKKKSKNRFQKIMLALKFVGIVFFVFIVRVAMEIYGSAYIIVVAVLAAAAVLWVVYEIGTIIGGLIATHLKLIPPQ